LFSVIWTERAQPRPYPGPLLVSSFGQKITLLAGLTTDPSIWVPGWGET